MTTNSPNTIGKNKNPTKDEARIFNLGLIAAQTSYANGNGGGIEPNKPMLLIDDIDSLNKGGIPFDIKNVDGYFFSAVIKDMHTGLDAFISFNKEEKSIVVGIAGTNGLFNDKADTYEDLMHIGARQSIQLYESSIFRNAINDALKSIGGIQNLKEFIIAGQSLGGANARNTGMLLINGNPSSLENTGIFGLKPEQLKVVTINSPGGGIAMTAMGYSKEKIDEYNASNIQLNLVAHNIKTGMIDLAAQIGGKQGGKSFGLTVDDEITVLGLHQLNRAVIKGVNNVKGDLTKLKEIEVPSLSHETISQNLQWLNIQKQVQAL